MTARLDLDAQIRAVEAAASTAPGNAALRQAVKTLIVLRDLDPRREIWATCHVCGSDQYVARLTEKVPDGLIRAMEGLMP